MAVFPSQAMLAKNKPGGLYRRKAEERAASSALPGGQGDLGSLTRNLVEEPLERPVAPGAKKVVGVKPAIEEASMGMGFLPSEAQSVAGEVSGPEGMGMFSKASTPKASKPSSSGVKSKLSSTTPSSSGVSVKAPAPKKSSPVKAVSGKLSGSEIAGPSESVIPGKKLSTQQQNAVKSSLSERVKNEGISGVVKSSVKDPVGALKGLVQRVVKTATNVKYKDNKGYQNLLRSLTQPKKTGVSRNSS